MIATPPSIGNVFDWLNRFGLGRAIVPVRIATAVATGNSNQVTASVTTIARTRNRSENAPYWIRS